MGGGGGGTKTEYKETSTDAQSGAKIFTILIFSSQIMLHDIRGELQLDENISVILPELFRALSTHYSLFPVLNVFNVTLHSIAVTETKGSSGRFTL